MADNKRVTLQFPVFEQSELMGDTGNYILPKGMMVFITDSESNPKKIYMRVGDGVAKLSELSNLSDMAATSLTLTSLIIGEGTAGSSSLVVGNGTANYKSVAEGNGTSATGEHSHAEGSGTEATDYSAHAEGWQTKATADSAHAEGYRSIASGEASHAEGSADYYETSKTWGNTRTTASGFASHAEGIATLASGKASHAGGHGTIASGDYQTVIGTYNAVDLDALFIIGNGTSDTNRSNALVVKKNGDVYINGNKIN